MEKLSTEEVGWSYSLQLLVVAETYGGDFDELLPLYEATGSEYPTGTQIFPASTPSRTTCSSTGRASW